MEAVTNVVSLSDYHADGWNSGRARCIACGHDWVQVAPTGDDWFECPSCGLHKGRYRYAMAPEAGQQIWQCNCGCDVLFATPTALRCCNCGASQRPFDQPGAA